VEVRTTVTAGRLSGRKCFVVPAATADGFLVTAGGANGLALHWIPANAEGVSISLDASVDGGFVGTVTFDRAAATLLADGPDVSPIIDAALDEACLAAAAELVGVMSAALDMTLAYTRQRVQFGVAIGSFQALQHRLVDLWMQAQLSRAALRRAIAAFDAEPLARALAVTAAKARASDAALLIARQGIQLHGGMGYTDACDIGLCLKRAVMLSAFLGNGTVQRRRFAALVGHAA
jgi:alkylation response protein AidB-like acyl-CoA dehydrogenase